MRRASTNIYLGDTATEGEEEQEGARIRGRKASKGEEGREGERGGREREGGRPVQCTNPHNPKAVLRNLRGSGANETLH